jgi:prophage maintenance system killer protein
MSASQDEKYTIFLKLAQGALSEEELAEWIRNKLV